LNFRFRRIRLQCHAQRHWTATAEG
jgi:hypothetical protein